MPLLAKAGGYDDDNLPLALSPSLGQENPSLNRLSQPNFVGEDRPFGQRGAEGEQGSFDLMGVQVNLSVSKRSSQLLHAVGRAPFCQFIRKILRVICGTHRGVKANDTSRVASPSKAQPDPLCLPQMRGLIRDRFRFLGIPNAVWLTFSAFVATSNI